MVILLSVSSGPGDTADCITMSRRNVPICVVFVRKTVQKEAETRQEIKMAEGGKRNDYITFEQKHGTTYKITST